MARRRSSRRRRRARAGVYVRRRGRTRRIKVIRVRARSHGLRRRRYYKANPRRRRRHYRHNPFRMGRGLLGGIPSIKTIALAGAGAVLGPLVLSKVKILDKLPAATDASGKPSLVGVAVRALAGAVALSFVGKALKKPQLGRELALGAVVYPVAKFFFAQPFAAGLAGDTDFGNLGGAEYSMPQIQGGEYTMPVIQGDEDEGPDFGNM